MTVAELIAELADPTAYPFPVGEVELRQTHISAVFLVGDHVYKVKKPVDYGFLDSIRNRECEPDADVAAAKSPGRILIVKTREDLTMLQQTLQAIERLECGGKIT